MEEVVVGGELVFINSGDVRCALDRGDALGVQAQSWGSTMVLVQT